MCLPRAAHTGAPLRLSDGIKQEQQSANHSKEGNTQVLPSS